MVISNTTMSPKMKRQDEGMKDSCSDKVPNDVDSQVKTENVLSTEADNHQNCHNANYEAQDMIKSPKHEIIKKESSGSPLFKSPVNRKQDDKSLQSDDIAHKIPSLTKASPSLNKTRKYSISSDYDMFKSELENVENFQNFENIELVHDLNTLVHFADTKISSDFLSSMIDINRAQETDDSMMQTNINKDPLTDPLFIGGSDEENINATFVESKSKSPSKKQIQRRRSARLLNKQTQSYVTKLSVEETRHVENQEAEDILDKLKDKEKQEKMPLIIIKKLQELHVKLIHEVPPQHQMELTGTHASTKAIRNLFHTYGPLRKGSYSPMEDKTIIRNWEMFCKLHDWDSKNAEPFLCWRHNGKFHVTDIEERQKFVQFLANGLPWRTLYSVYNRFKLLHQNKIIRIRYTAAEDRKILMFIKNKHLRKRGAKRVELAKLLGRTKRSVRRRYRELKNKFESKNRSGSEAEPLQNVTWTLPLIKKFISTLLNVTLSEDIKELKYATLPKPLWQKMEKKLNIHEKVLKTFWQNQLHLQLFSTSPIYLNDIKIQLIEYMYAKGISHTREIIWPNVAYHFDGATAEFLCKVFFHLVQECDINDMDNFAETVEYLHQKIPEIQKAPTDKFLPRIVCKNEKIDVLDVESNNEHSITTSSESLGDNSDIDYSDSDM